MTRLFKGKYRKQFHAPAQAPLVAGAALLVWDAPPVGVIWEVEKIALGLDVTLMAAGGLITPYVLNGDARLENCTPDRAITSSSGTAAFRALVLSINLSLGISPGERLAVVATGIVGGTQLIGGCWYKIAGEPTLDELGPEFAPGVVTPQHPMDTLADRYPEDRYLDVA